MTKKQKSKQLDELQDKIRKLESENECLRKAGDKVAGNRKCTFTPSGILIDDPAIVEWNNAKNGK